MHVRHKPKPLQDHPRRCGENLCEGANAIIHAGSPPQVRGKLSACQVRFVKTWITPAGAGKTIYNRMGKIQNKDHPRRCGENYIELRLFSELNGSPPQVRGKPGVFLPAWAFVGITPAGAGKTYVQYLIDFTAKDHPRRCGENRTTCKT